jgi:SARP family transcriptional regulator, regulator of embCAB operon
VLQFRALGPLEVVCGDRVCTPTASKPRQVLALLMLCANRVVNIDLMIEELWGMHPPRSAVATTQTYIYQLRNIITRERPGRRGADLVTRPSGYVLAVDPDQVDAFVFQRLVRCGRRQLENGNLVEATEVLRRALDMWRGPVLADVVQESILGAHTVPLEELRLRTLELRIQADFRLGLHRELIGELGSLIAAHPLNEWFYEQLIIALGRSGRRSEALQVYQNLRQTLSQELGLDPSAELQRLQHEVLNGFSDRIPSANVGIVMNDLYPAAMGVPEDRPVNSVA